MDKLLSNLKRKFSLLEQNQSLIVVDDSAFEGKDDPTQYNNEEEKIYVKSNYNVKEDKEAWIVHELGHHRYRNKEDDNKPYPYNKVERFAYQEQFKELKRRGFEFEDLLNKEYFPTLSLKLTKYNGEYYDILKKYWDSVNKE